MSLGLPVHLVPHNVRRGMARASHVVALVCLGAAILVTVSVQSRFPDRVLWPALVAMAVMVGILVALMRFRTLVWTAAYLFVGAACVFWVSLVALSQFPGATTSDTFVLSMLKVALIMVGFVGTRTFHAVFAAGAGFVLAGVATMVAVRQTDAVFIVDATAVASFLLVVTLHLGLAAGRRAPSAQPSLHRAARDEQIAATRYRIEAKAAAVMHDTVLNHLAAIANAPDGPLGRQLRDQIDRDLEVLVGEEWLLDADAGTYDQARNDWLQSRLFAAVDEARELGLDVEVTGDVHAVTRLGTERAAAVALATKQCLVNVLKHSGTDRAELVVYGSDREVSVMVIDAGAGFSEEETGDDRLGLRHSVRRRIESVGGTVQVWSRPGKGTTVMIRVPAVEGTVGAVERVEAAVEEAS